MDMLQEMKEVSVAEILKEHSLVVPEIQREYVWGRNDYDILKTFLEDIKKGFNNPSDNIDDNTKSLLPFLETANELQKKVLMDLIANKSNENNIMNIGFLYSYKPNYFITDEGKDAYLIDGQQRFTTIFLILFYLAIKEERYNDFIQLYRVKLLESKIGFDYRVRSLTHNFIIDLIKNTTKFEDLLTISDKRWFLSNYKKDSTIRAIVGDRNSDGAFKIIHEQLHSLTNGYFDFVMNNIKFWHFKTEETSQGEELYITMNSRGQQLADNETIKAKLFELEGDQLKWSAKWEEWQDFFWKNRNKKDPTSNADKGFNEFLRWIQIIKMAENQTIDVNSEDENSIDRKSITQIIKWEANQKLSIQYLNLPEIEEYFDIVYYLFIKFKSLNCELSTFFGVYNNFDLLKSEWLSKAIDQIDCFNLLPIIYYCKKAGLGSINPISLFRIIRFFSNLTKDDTIKKTSAIQCINALKAIEKISNGGDILEILNADGISQSILNQEEKSKFLMFKSDNRKKLEILFWQAEDLKVNKGKIAHLINFTKKQINNNSITSFTSFFEKLFAVYKELTDEYGIKIWGDLLITDVYEIESDRVFYVPNWHETFDFMNLVYEKISNKLEYNDFLIEKQKNFINKYYVSADSMFQENHVQKQLYLIYILHSAILKHWDWNERFNFGIYNEPENDEISLFKNNLIFQLYNSQWRYNQGYNPEHGVWLQDHFDPYKNYFQELLNWAKN